MLDAALRLVDAGGADALSLRSVAAAVGVAPNALYTYFPTKAALVSALVDDVLGHVDREVLRASGARRDRVTDFALDLRAVLLAHPGVVPFLLRSGFDGANALAGSEALLDLLVDAGLPPADASRAAYLLITYVLGTVALDVAELPPGRPRPDDATRIRERRQRLADVPADRFPRTAATADTVAAYNSTAQYRWGLDRLLAGLGT